MKTTGTIKKIIGAVVDVDFGQENQTLPDIYTALVVKKGDKNIVLEVEQHLGGSLIRTVAMDSTDGLFRGMEVINTGAPISVPVGVATLGRIFNVLGEVIDDLPQPRLSATPPKLGGEGGGLRRMPIHRKAPDYIKQSTKVDCFI